jgi:hypothetical protein
MSARKRSAPGREIAGAAKLRLAESYQHCKHTATVIPRMPEGHTHYVQLKCASCGLHIRWLPKPETIERRRLNGFKLAKLAMCDRLTSWEWHFVRDLQHRKKLSPRQQAVIDKLAVAYLEEAA